LITVMSTPKTTFIQSHCCAYCYARLRLESFIFDAYVLRSYDSVFKEQAAVRLCVKWS
jgi:hypothetical protein